MLIESIISLVKEPQSPKPGLKKKKKFLDYLPFKLRFRQSGIYISIFYQFSRIIHRFPCFFNGSWWWVCNGSCYDLFI